MNPQQARARVAETFPQQFNRGKFLEFTRNLLNKFDESKAQRWNSQYIKDAFKPHVSRFERLGTYTSPDEDKLDVLIVHLTNESKLERARTAIRNFVADHLKQRDNKDAALVAFVSPTERQWRFSYVKMEYAAVETEAGRVGIETLLTPARRFSYIVGEGESCHTAQTRFLDLLQDTNNFPTLGQLEDVFSVEAVTKEFFNQYAGLFNDIDAALQKLAAKDPIIGKEFKVKNVRTVDFAKKLMGQIVFLYFVQKKGWLGVAKGQDWGTGPHDFLRRLARGDHGAYGNFFNDVLEPLFYDTLATDRGHEARCNRFKCRIPFLNGGLFEPVANYDWRKTDIILPNKLFTNTERNDAGDVGTGILDVFDRYNFTVNEAEPLEKEVAIDPEMLGKVFENLIEDNRRKGLGSFYTPREIVHYMCQESLINYLDTALNKEKELVPRKDIETFIYLGEQISHYEAVDAKYPIKMPATIEKHARLIDERLAIITVCDPAVGSGAYPVGMMMEIVRARCALTPYFNDVHERTYYHFKRRAIQNSLYGVDIDPGAVEIAKLRLWLSLVVDEEDVKQIKPLPNLDYKIMTGNSLLGVEKTLFNEQIFQRLEKLKPLFFDETDRLKKEKLKKEIYELIHQLTNGKEVFDFEIYFSEVFHNKSGFDVMLANPPYVGHKGGQKSLFNEMKRNSLGIRFNNERMDLFYYFFHLAIDRARESGVVAFITTNYYVTADSAIKLRTDFRDRTSALILASFNELKIFESALGQHNMITVLRKGQDHSVKCRLAVTKRTGLASPELLRSILHGSDNETFYRDISQKNLYEGKMLYISSVNVGAKNAGAIDRLLAKLSVQQTRIGDVCNIGQGIVTGLDRISPKHLKRLPRAQLGLGLGCFVLAETERRQLSNSRDSVIKPWFKNSDVHRYACNCSNSEWLIHATVDLDPKEHKGVFEHLRALQVAIESRNYDSGELSKASKLGAWWALSSARKDFDFGAPKIVGPQRSYRNTFGYNEVPWYASGDVYFITTKKPSVALKFVLALLNSKLYFVWLYFKGKRKGEMLELYQKPLSEIPIKMIPPAEQKPFVALVDKILAAKQRDAEADTSGLEREIDDLVYSLYGLTAEEIALVQAGAK
jgi:type I restriction-modification system DNA methylase subunit